MSSIKRILVVVNAEEDFSKAPDGLPVELRKALRFANDKSKVEIHLLSVSHERFLHHGFKTISADYVAMREEFTERIENSLQSIAARLQGQGFKVSAEVVWAHPRFEQTLRKADEFNADLVVQHVRAYAKLEHYFLTNDSWQLVRFCNRPLLLVKDAEWSDPVVMMAAVDPLHTHKKPLQLDNFILDMGLDVSAQLGAELHVVHAYGESTRPFATADKIREDHSEAYDALLTGYDFPTSNIHFINETPLYALQHYSEQIQSNILVMGAISRSRFSEALIGSTAEQALDYIKTDVLIVKPQMKV